MVKEWFIMFKKYLENEQFNLQINRFFGKFNDPKIQECIENILQG